MRSLVNTIDYLDNFRKLFFHFDYDVNNHITKYLRGGHVDTCLVDFVKEGA